MDRYILPELTSTVSSGHKFQVITSSKAIYCTQSITRINTDSKQI